MQIERDVLIFSTGRRLYAFDAVIGLGLEGPMTKTRISHGYDGRIDTVVDPHYSPETSAGEELTIEETRELADHMIATWTAFRDGLPETTVSGEPE